MLGRPDRLDPASRAQDVQDHHDRCDDGIRSCPPNAPRHHHRPEPGVGQVHSADTGRTPKVTCWPTAHRSGSGPHRSVPVEWDEVKEQLTALSTQLGPQQGWSAGAALPWQFVNQAADTFDGNGDRSGKAAARAVPDRGATGDSRTDLFGTVRNLQVLVNALSNSNEQIVQFTNHVASVSQVMPTARPRSRRHAGHAQPGPRRISAGCWHESNKSLIDSVGKLADFTQILTDHSDDIEQILYVTPNGLANFYNIYNPAQGTVGGLLSLPNFANPVQFICGGTFDIGGASPDNYKRRRDLPPADGAGTQAHRHELPAHPVPSDQQHHRLQGADHLRHPGHRGQGRDTGALSAVAACTRRDTRPPPPRMAT